MREIVSPLDGFASPFGPQRGFNPSRLFANDEPGVWFEANDSTTLFTDVAGTTPVTTPGDAVALQLDKSQGLTLGPELVTNGTFDTDVTGWNLVDGATAASVSWDAGRIVLPYVNGADFSYAWQLASDISTGKVYRVTFDAIDGTVSYRLGTGNFSAAYALGSVTAGNSLDLYVVTTSAALSVTVFGALGGTSKVDNISVRELPGNHRTQATTAARPLYALQPVGGVRNLLQYTEEFDNAVWTPLNAPTITSLGDGTFEIADDSSGGELIRQTHTALSSGATYTLQTKVKKDAIPRTTRFPALRINFSGGTAQFFDIAIDTLTGEFDTSFNSAPDSATVSDAGDYWLVSMTMTENGTNSEIRFDIYPAFGASDFASFSGNATGSATFKHPQLEQSSTATNYQRVGSFLDVSEEGKARRGRIWYNGTSHFMQTGTITPGTDKAQVFAGVRKLSDAAGMVAELSLNWATQPGTLSLQTGTQTGSAGSLYYYSSARGNAAATVTQGGEWQTADVSPDTAVLTGTHDIAGDLSTIRRNGVAGLNGTADKGLGNFLAYPLYFGARAGTSLFFNGYEDTSIVRFGPNLDADTISKVESYVASKTPEGTI